MLCTSLWFVPFIPFFQTGSVWECWEGFYLLLLSFGYFHIKSKINFPIDGNFVSLRHSSPAVAACGAVDLWPSAVKSSSALPLTLQCVLVLGPSLLIEGPGTRWAWQQHLRSVSCFDLWVLTGGWKPQTLQTFQSCGPGGDNNNPVD